MQAQKPNSYPISIDRFLHFFQRQYKYTAGTWCIAKTMGERINQKTLMIGTKRKIKAAIPTRDNNTHAVSQRTECIFFTLSLDVSCILIQVSNRITYLL